MMTDQTSSHADATVTPAASAATAETKRRMPTGLKIAIGCLGVFFVLSVLAVVAIGAGGMWLKDKADGVVEGVQARAEAQQQAASILDRLERDHPFSPPADDRIDPASAERFFEAVGIAWTEIEPTVRNLDEIARRNREAQPRLGDVVDGMRNVGLLADSRLHIARALEESDISLEEFVWIGQRLRNARHDGELPAAYADRLASIDSATGEPSASVVLDLAIAWGRGLPDVSSPDR